MSRCPFLAKASAQQINNCSEKVLKTLSSKCPFVGKIQPPARSECYSTCPFSSKAVVKNEKELKLIAQKCCKTAQTQISSTADAELAKKLKSNGYRIFEQVQRSAARPTRCHTSTGPKINWSSNDYLGLSTHPDVISKTVEVLDANGVGAGGTRNISGTSIHHEELEQRLAAWHGHEQGLLFSSCYVANESVISQLGQLVTQRLGKKFKIVSDQKNHASIIQGIRKACKNHPEEVEKVVFKHNDMEHLESILMDNDEDTITLIIFESVYSMEGDIGDIERITALAREYNCLTFCDEVHAVGLYGQNGHGLCEPHHNVDFITGTLGKALGSLGGYVTANNSSMIEYFRLYCPGLIFTTSLPPLICAAANHALGISCSSEGDKLRYLHRKNVNFMKDQLLRFFPDHEKVFDESNHIIPIFFNNAEKVGRIQKLMLERGHYVQAINSPTVAVGEERLRVVVTPQHSERDILRFVEDLMNVCDEPVMRMARCEQLSSFKIDAF